MTENIKAAIEYGVELSQGQSVIYKEGDRIFYDRNKASLIELETTKLAETLQVNTLSSLVDFLKEWPENEEMERLVVNVENCGKVKVYSALNYDRKRESRIESNAVLDCFPFSRFIDSEEFIIKIQSLFQKTKQADLLIKLVSGIRIEGGADLKDNGFSQTVTVRNGANVENVELPNPFILKPFRTFLEVEQPESAFVFRVNKQGDCALFEADGGIWKNEATENIKKYLEKNMSELVAAKAITILA